MNVGISFGTKLINTRQDCVEPLDLIAVKTNYGQSAQPISERAPRNILGDDVRQSLVSAKQECQELALYRFDKSPDVDSCSSASRGSSDMIEVCDVKFLSYENAEIYVKAQLLLPKCPRQIGEELPEIPQDPMKVLEEFLIRYALLLRWPRD